MEKSEITNVISLKLKLNLLVNFWFLLFLKEYLECYTRGEGKISEICIFIYEISGSEVHFKSRYFFSM